MNRTVRALTITFACIIWAALAKGENTWTPTYKQISGQYMLYGGSLGEIGPPTGTDRKVSFKFTGVSAQNLFDSIGPDTQHACTSAEGVRERRKGQLYCIFDPLERYACYVGFDLRTGRAIAGSSC